MWELAVADDVYNRNESGSNIREISKKFIASLIAPYIRMLSSDWLMKGVFFFYQFLVFSAFPPFGLGNFSFLDWYFSQIPLPNMIYLYIITLA